MRCGVGDRACLIPGGVCAIMTCFAPCGSNDTYDGGSGGGSGA